jgi:predicted ABC-type ATPase
MYIIIYMDNITGKASSSVENTEYTNITTEKINNKSIADEFTEQDQMEIDIQILQNTVNTLINFINTHFELDFQGV